jgi:hypothetical protein
MKMMNMFGILCAIGATIPQAAMADSRLWSTMMTETVSDTAVVLTTITDDELEWGTYRRQFAFDDASDFEELVDELDAGKTAYLSLSVSASLDHSVEDCGAWLRGVVGLVDADGVVGQPVHYFLSADAGGAVDCSVDSAACDLSGTLTFELTSDMDFESVQLLIRLNAEVYGGWASANVSTGTPKFYVE